MILCTYVIKLVLNKYVFLRETKHYPGNVFYTFLQVY